MHTHHERCSRGLASARAWRVGKDMVLVGRLYDLRRLQGFNKFKMEVSLLVPFLYASNGDRSVANGRRGLKQHTMTPWPFSPGLQNRAPRTALLQGCTVIAMTWPHLRHLPLCGGAAVH
jgi:hypothetical protein